MTSTDVETKLGVARKKFTNKKQGFELWEYADDTSVSLSSINNKRLLVVGISGRSLQQSGGNSISYGDDFKLVSFRSKTLGTLKKSNVNDYTGEFTYYSIRDNPNCKLFFIFQNLKLWSISMQEKE